MARRSTAPQLPPPVLTTQRAEVARKIEQRIEAGRQLQSRQIRNSQDSEEYKKESKQWTEYNDQLLKTLFTNDSLSTEYQSISAAGIPVFDESQLFELYRGLTSERIEKLESILHRLELYQEPSAPSSEPHASVLPRGLSKVFLVHGHDEAAKLAVARFLEKIKLEAIILQEQPDQGLTIIEKFEYHASQVGFAVVLLTPDDLGGPASASTQSLRARQNVIFELGYFVGKLGRGRACLLRKGNAEVPSDLYGVVYTEMDGADGWKIKLARELRAARLKFDTDSVLG